MFRQDASTILTINEATDSEYVSQSYCRICDDTMFHYFAFANDLAFIYFWKHNNTTLLYNVFCKCQYSCKNLFLTLQEAITRMVDKWRFVFMSVQ